MTGVITDEILVASFLCLRKGYLLLFSDERGQLHEYQQILEKSRLYMQQKYLDSIRQNPDTYLYSAVNIEKEFKFLVNAHLVVGNLQADCSLLSKIDAHTCEPTLFVGTHNISETDKLRIAFIGHVLGEIQGKPPTYGYIVTITGKSYKVKLLQNRKNLTNLLNTLQGWTTNARSIDEPPVVINKHCQLCQFRLACEFKAVQEDNLSLLTGVTPRIVRRYERKGIFTVKQLSYLFKPRRRKKRAKRPPPSVHNIELQALAIRTGRIYIQELPTVMHQEIELFLDIESVPDQDLHYLIGLLICNGEESTYCPFWADEAGDEGKIWRLFLAKANQYPDAPIYHYGSYESRTVTKLAKRYATDVESLTKHMINIHKQIFGRLYFPVFSNRLKDVAGFCGAKWTEGNSSGLQSIVWRLMWETTHQDQYEDMLLTYNREDCEALKLLSDKLSNICSSAKTLPEVDFADDLKQQISEVSETVSGQFKKILKFSQFEYDKSKIHFRQELESRASAQRKVNTRILASKKSHEKLAKIRSQAEQIVMLPSDRTCPQCGNHLRPTKAISKRVIVDLALAKHGIEKTITEFSGNKSHCPKCQKDYAPPSIRKYPKNQVYGHNFESWVVYQRVALRLPYESIVELAFEQFDENFSITQIQEFLEKIAKYYALTEQQIVENLLKSPFIHVDETRANVQGASWYVWVFTDGKNVLFRLTETRETAIVQEFLARYDGVLIADFYGGYDAVNCKQQRCWVHLIRDLNDKLREYPFDKEYETFVLEIRDLIIPIMETVQQYGLKMNHLTQFIKQVDDFYMRVIIEKQYKSDLVCTFQKRFIRYRDSLFTFLELDEIPWNNNVAERAIRPFAKQRDISTSLQASVLRNYLALLGIRQTCRFQDKSFFKFLFSGEVDLENFSTGTHKH
jgi:predicted RecB family nuclease